MTAPEENEFEPDAPVHRARFAGLFDDCADALFAFARLRLPPGLYRIVDPEDVVQEAFCRGYSRFESFDPGRGDFRAWMFGIAKNVLADFLMAAARKPSGRIELDPARSSDEAWNSIADTATSISRRAARNEVVARLLDAADSWSNDERRLFTLRALEELSHDVIAAKLGLSVEVVEKRWQRLRVRLTESSLPLNLGTPRSPNS